MIRATTITREFDTPAATIALDETARHRRRMRMSARTGSGEALEFLLDLPAARLLRHGDGIVLDDGRIVAVEALPEPLMEVRGRDARHLLALAWQIGNRHLAAQIEGDRLLIRRDPVIADMLIGLGATLHEVDAPFDPQGGAYAVQDHHHRHDH